MMGTRKNQTNTRIRGNARRQKDRGAVLLEFVFSFMFYLLVTLVGIMDFGRGIWAYNVLAHASHEAARYAMVRGADSLSPASASDIQDFVRSRATFLPPSSVSVNVQWQSENSPGNTVEIQVVYDFQPLLAPFLPDFSLSSTSRMVITN